MYQSRYHFILMSANATVYSDFGKVSIVEQETAKISTLWDKIDGRAILASIIASIVGGLIVLVGTYFMHQDERLKDSLQKEISYAESMSADLSVDFAILTLRISETQIIPQKEKSAFLIKTVKLYQALDRVQTRLAGTPDELKSYKAAISDLRASMVRATSFMEYKQVIEAMGLVILTERAAFNWLATEADIKKSS